jgi:signal transduction histidine kinase
VNQAVDSRGYLEELEQLLKRSGDLSEHAKIVVSSARRHAESVIAAGGGAPDAMHAGLVNFVADVLNGLWLEREWPTDDAQSLFHGMAEVTGLPIEYVAVAVALRALSHPSALELPPATAIEAELGMLFAFAPVTAVSLWTRELGGRLRCVVYRGPTQPSRRMRALAACALAGEEAAGQLQAVPILRWEEPRAALVARAAPGGQQKCLVCLREAAGTLGPVFERQALLEQSAEREQSLVQASERALVRLGFDLHDGPIQDVTALALELETFRRQLASTLPRRAPERELLLGRVDDLHARLAALDADVRELSRSLDAPALANRPLEDALSAELDILERASGINPKLSLSGDFSGLTPSQRIALLRIVHEALTNIRHHSGATRVRVDVTANEEHVRARIEDNGRGFDVDRTLSGASRRGRLGLLGMGERARLLGGSCNIRSAPGGPTVVSLVLLRWDPASAIQPPAIQPTGRSNPVGGRRARASRTGSP